MPYFMMLAICLPWAWWAARRNWSARFSLSLFFAASLFMSAAEPVMVRFLDLYDWQLWLLADPERDQSAGTYVVALLLDPLLGVIYAAYCRTRPVLRALLAAFALGGLEILLVHMDYMVYRSWHPLLTVAAFFVYLLILWHLTVKEPPWLVWLSVHGASLWFAWLFSILPRSVLLLWESHIVITGDPARDNRIFSILSVWLLVAPITTAVSMIRTRRRWLWAAGGMAVMLLVQWIFIANGWITSHGGSPWLSVLLGWVSMGCVVLYTNWLRSATQSPPHPSR